MRNKSFKRPTTNTREIYGTQIKMICKVKQSEAAITGCIATLITQRIPQITIEVSHDKSQSPQWIMNRVMPRDSQGIH